MHSVVLQSHGGNQKKTNDQSGLRNVGGSSSSGARTGTPYPSESIEQARRLAAAKAALPRQQLLSETIE
jgi:hypothetical protein